MVNGEEKMGKEQIIENYIDHIRNISELTDEEIESVINDAIEEDDEFLEVLGTFLNKRDKIREKLVTLDVVKEDEERADEEEIEDLVSTFEDIDNAYPIEEIMERLKKTGYANPGQVIFDALEDMLYIDSIEDDGTIYFALTSTGEKLWESLN
jgi:hypothetical protein